ncbi:undecaprenyl-phosphate glucose phosphotransferase [Polaribacter sp. Q13]|uniref:undecaprenyl-phosphate glucose phosphotransferase n=1 Tax=Polaribacter sp. Q13 TaxID=2806551 RepID=UPI00193B2E12|nr:undecaprenyl-phosphate glucose phosphotransferase [Polaribacter sp. Q13]QVY66619.1 undecaprenyl-phosphate glucose phosphotransferase [Polaribacter sp. Q13]
MPKGRIKYLPIPAFFIDGLLFFVSFFTANYIVFDGVFPEIILYRSIFLFGLLLWLGITFRLKMYDIPRIIYTDKVVSKSLHGLTLFTLIGATFLYLLIEYKFSRDFFIITILLFGVMHAIFQILLMYVFKRYRKRGHNIRKVIVLGFDSKIEKLIKSVLMVPENGYELHSIFSDNEVPESLQTFYKGKESELIPYLDKSKEVNALFISLPPEKSAIINKYISYADNHLIRVYILPNFSEYLFQHFRMTYINKVATLYLRAEPLESLTSRMTKRACDFVFSLLVLIGIGVWLYPLLAIIIKLNSKGPVLFSQMRSGKDDKPFKCYKFRSMTVNTESDSLQATKNDSRVTSIGRILRKTSLDELPQFYNVLIGNMSVVGPRPHMLVHTESYRKSVQKFMVRHFVKPGITGWAQVTGFRGETKTVQDMKNRAQADIWYIENWNLILDVKILFLTIWQVVFKKDSNAF